MVKTYGLTHAAMSVRDIEKTLRFYRSVFGVEEYWREEGVVHVRTPGAQDVITFTQGASAPGESAGIAHIGFRLVNAADIDQAVQDAEAGGGTLLRRGEFSPGFPYAYVADPDGYEVEIWFE
jgi:catechol 2,3-dioxygenase-like lactoylglutathione lyase family enzyme